MIYMLWKECMPHRFYQHICKEKNFFYLNGKNVLQPKVLEIKKKKITKTWEITCLTIKTYYSMILNCFPEIYCSTERRGFNFKSNFYIIFKNLQGQEKIRSLWQKTFIIWGNSKWNVCMNKNQLKLMILMRQKKKKLRSTL